MVSLPTEINAAQERLLHDILDEGINELRGNTVAEGEMQKNELRISHDTNTEFLSGRPNDQQITESPLISLKQRPLSMGGFQQKSSTLAQVIEEAKNSDPSLRKMNSEVPFTASAFGSNQAPPTEGKTMENELSFLQSKIQSLESRLSASTKSPLKPYKENIPTNSTKKTLGSSATKKSIRKPLVKKVKEIKKISQNSDDSQSSSDSENSSDDSVENTPAALKKSSHTRSISNARTLTKRATSVTSLRSNFTDTLAKSTRMEDRFTALKKQCEDTKTQLIKERQKTHELTKKLEKYEREYNMKKSVYEELRETKAEFEQLKVSFEKSEKLRRHQKEIIKELQQEIENNKLQFKPEEKSDKKPKTKKSGKKKDKKSQDF